MIGYARWFLQLRRRDAGEPTWKGNMQSTANSVCKVLIVDDDIDLSHVWRDILSLAGFDVLTSNSGLKGLDTIRYGGDIDVVLLDHNMPTLDGTHTLEHLKTQFPNVKAIGITGVESSRLPAAYREGVQKLLTKPVSSSDLIDAVRSVTGVRAAAETEPVKPSINWARFAPWYALYLIASAGIVVLLDRAASILVFSW
jgi:DNA-binding NtrC family response regulator